MLLLRRSLLAGVPTPFVSFSSHPLPLLPRSRGLAFRSLARAAAPPLPSPPATSRASWSVRGGFVPADTSTRSIRRGRASPPASGLVQPRRWRRGEAWTCVKRACATMWKVGWRRTGWLQSPTRRGSEPPEGRRREKRGSKSPKRRGGRAMLGVRVRDGYENGRDVRRGGGTYGYGRFETRRGRDGAEGSGIVPGRVRGHVTTIERRGTEGEKRAGGASVGRSVRGDRNRPVPRGRRVFFFSFGFGCLSSSATDPFGWGVVPSTPPTGLSPHLASDWWTRDPPRDRWEGDLAPTVPIPRFHPVETGTPFLSNLDPHRMDPLRLRLVLGSLPIHPSPAIPGDGGSGRIPSPTSKGRFPLEPARPLDLLGSHRIKRTIRSVFLFVGCCVHRCALSTSQTPCRPSLAHPRGPPFALPTAGTQPNAPTSSCAPKGRKHLRPLRKSPSGPNPSSIPTRRRPSSVEAPVDCSERHR